MFLLVSLFSGPLPSTDTHLFFVSEYRVQFDEGQAVPVTYRQIRPFLDSAYLLATFPTGSDVGLRTLRRAATECQGQVYLDYHILTRGRDESGVRYLRWRPKEP